MTVQLDSSSPLPLYYQIAEAIRYRIATGAVKPGEQLTPLRQAANNWGVNLHTVRRAYAELADAGLVEIKQPAGARVLARLAGGSHDLAALGAFVRRVIKEARERHGLGVEQFVAALHNAGAAARARPAPTFVVECSATQSEDLAHQIEERWQTNTTAWSLDRQGEPPPGHVIATYFHYNDIRRRWPGRFADVRFLAIRPDPMLVKRLASETRRERASKIVLCEHESTMATSIAADLQAALAGLDLHVEQRISDDPGALLARAPKAALFLFSPRVWGELTASQRAQPRAAEVRYVFEPGDLAALGSELEWLPR